MNLSIIVPVYNMQKYLYKCLESLVNQRNDNYKYEIICINDGSEDNSLEILQRYQSKFGNLIKVINIRNQGVSNARNIGIEEASGEYIAFVDSDDWVEENFVKLAIESMIKSNKDLVIFDTVYVSNKEYIKKERIEHIIFNTENHVCGKIFKKNIIDKYQIKFPVNISIGEDMVFTFSYISVTDKFEHIEYNMYYYRQDREGSAMTSKINLKYNEVFLACEYIYIFNKKNNLLEKNKNGLEYIFIKNLIVRNTLKIVKSKKNIRIIIKEIKNEIIFIKNYFPNWENNEYMVDDKENYFKDKLGIYYLKVLKNISSNLSLTILYFIIGKLKGENNGNK